MLEEITSQYSPGKLEKEIQELWETSNAYSKVREHRKGGKRFFFVDGPPYTTGHIHLGTAWNKIIKDSILRYRSMKACDIQDRAGWDMHGLPIEVKVEGVLGFTSKKDIEAYGVGNFIEKCKEFALMQKDAMTQQFRMLGVWLDWEDPYMTLRDEYIEAAWWTLKRAQEKHLLEQGKRVVNWCPRCETAIADSEVEYSDRDDPSIFVKFKLKDEENTFVVIWTTTPWTIPSNIAVAVQPSFEYSKVWAKSSDGREETLIIATSLVEAVLKKGRYTDFKVLGSMLGEQILSMAYEHPLVDKVPRQASMAHNIYPGDFVTAENTGCVHIAPGHGMDDFELGLKHGLPVFCPVGPDGRYTEAAGDYAGMHIRDANAVVIEDLKQRGLLLAKGKINHRYGHCWRCKTPIIFLATEQWFIKISDLKEQMLSEIQQINWYPSWAGSARFKDWVEGARDWCVSRQRYWGIPIPVWKCRTCESMRVIGTKKELIELAGLSEDIELHRPYVDAVTFKCQCGGTMGRVEDVFDVWFDSAVASWATLRFPQHSEELDKWWPADFITEGHDQTRGWFYSQLGASMVAFGKAPYKSVLMHGFTLDGEGKKMSKSLGNVIEPGDVIAKYGADTLRCFVLSANAPWEDLKFNSEEIATINRTLNILWNVYRFPLPYMVLDSFDPSKVSLASVKEHMRKEDKWILSRAQTLINDVDKAMEQYTLHRALRAINEFVLEDLSRWYVQLIRPRTWVEADDPDKLAVYRVLYEVFVITTKVIAPFMPHLAEEMYQNLVRNVYPDAPMSVHMNDWPIADGSLVDKELETHMDMIRSMVEASSNARQKAGRKLRWPVSRIVVTTSNEQVFEAVANLRSVLMDQTNAKDIVLVDVGQAWNELRYEAIPNPSTIGPVFKGDAGKVLNAIKNADVVALRNSLIANGQAEVELSGKMVTITPEMVKFEERLPEMVASAEFNAGTVYVDAKLTRELESEGYAREIIRRVQDMRKELDLAVDRNISVGIRISDRKVLELALCLEQHIAKEIRADVLVMSLDIDTTGTLSKDWDVEGISMSIAISPV